MQAAGRWWWRTLRPPRPSPSWSWAPAWCARSPRCSARSATQSGDRHEKPSWEPCQACRLGSISGLASPRSERHIKSMYAGSGRCTASRNIMTGRGAGSESVFQNMTSSGHGEKQCMICMRCRYDAADQVFVCRLPDSSRPEFYLHPAVVRRNDTSAKSINEWTGEKTLRYPMIPTRVKQSLYVCTSRLLNCMHCHL